MSIDDIRKAVKLYKTMQYTLKEIEELTGGQEVYTLQKSLNIHNIVKVWLLSVIRGSPDTGHIKVGRDRKDRRLRSGGAG